MLLTIIAHNDSCFYHRFGLPCCLCGPPWNTLQLLEQIVGYLHFMMIPMGEEQIRELFDFHKNLVLRFLAASSPRMRKWGWDQMDGLITLTHRHCCSPKAIRVSRGMSTKQKEWRGLECPNATRFGTTYIPPVIKLAPILSNK